MSSYRKLASCRWLGIRAVMSLSRAIEVMMDVNMNTPHHRRERHSGVICSLLQINGSTAAPVASE